MNSEWRLLSESCRNLVERDMQRSGIWTCSVDHIGLPRKMTAVDDAAKSTAEELIS